MKITHVFTNMNYVYTGALINMFSKHIEKINQIFFICDKEANVPEDVKCQNVNNKSTIHYSGTNSLIKQARQFKSILEENDYTIFHFLPNNIYFHSMLLANKNLYDKLIWRIWGADLYNWKKNGIKGLFLNKIRYFSRQNIKYVIAEPMDRPVYIEQFGDNICFLDGPDPKGYDVESLEKAKFPLSNDDIKRIIVGHSAVKTLNHNQILDKLKKYKDENIEIILPLNYGNAEYAKDVYNYAISIFSKRKVHLIDKKININEYMNLLWNCDVAIIHSDRQIAMGNITMLMYMQKKIYLKSESIMDKYYRKDQNLQIYNSNLIGTETYEDFISNDVNKINREFAIQEIDVNNISLIWKKTFMLLEKMELEKEN